MARNILVTPFYFPEVNGMSISLRNYMANTSVNFEIWTTNKYAESEKGELVKIFDVSGNGSLLRPSLGRDKNKLKGELDYLTSRDSVYLWGWDSAIVNLVLDSSCLARIIMISHGTSFRGVQKILNLSNFLRLEKRLQKLYKLYVLSHYTSGPRVVDVRIAHKLKLEVEYVSLKGLDREVKDSTAIKQGYIYLSNPDRVKAHVRLCWLWPKHTSPLYLLYSRQNYRISISKLIVYLRGIEVYFVHTTDQSEANKYIAKSSLGIFVSNDDFVPLVVKEYLNMNLAVLSIVNYGNEKGAIYVKDWKTFLKMIDLYENKKSFIS